MKKEKRRKILLTLAILILLAIIISGFVYAKYATTVTGDGNLSVARWSFLVDGQNRTIGDLDLGETSYDAKTISSGVIAPGTQGTFDVTINAKGTNTGVDYYVKFDSVTNKPSNLYFIIDGVTCRTLQEAENKLSGHFDATDTEKTITKTIKWVWDYQTTWNGQNLIDNDETDTVEGEAAKDFSFKLKVTGIQTEPKQNN